MFDCVIGVYELMIMQNVHDEYDDSSLVYSAALCDDSIVQQHKGTNIWHYK